MIRVLLADDQTLLLGALTTILNAQDDIRVTATAADGAAAVRAVREAAGGVDVAVLDIRMPGLDGIAAAREILALPDAPAVMMLTTFRDPALVRSAIAAGVHGFLLKDAEPDVLADAVRTVARGESVLASGVTGPVLEGYRQAVAARSALRPEERQGLSLLTARELEVLAEIGRGATNPEIAESLHIAETTVKTHVSNLLAKLGARDRVALVLLVQRAGLLPGRGQG